MGSCDQCDQVGTEEICRGILRARLLHYAPGTHMQPHGNPRSPGCAGFTFVEVVAAGFVFTVMALGLSASLATSAQGSEMARQEFAARAAISSLVAEMQSVPLGEVNTKYAGRAFEVAGLEAPPGEDKPGAVTIAAGPSDCSDLLRVTLRVRWHQGKRVREIESTHLLTELHG